MTDRPVIFSAPMIHALIDGRKTQARRVLKPQPDTKHIPKPYAIGDRLWVREKFSYDRLDVNKCGFLPPWYWADGNPGHGDWTKPKPSIHMPRWASRITLGIVDIRIEHLQSITGESASAEGIDPAPHRCGCEVCGMTSTLCTATGSSLALAYGELWDTIHGPGSWAANPWVVALTFTVRRGNIDATGG